LWFAFFLLHFRRRPPIVPNLNPQPLSGGVPTSRISFALSVSIHGSVVHRLVIDEIAPI